MPRRRGGSKRTANAMEEADGEAPPQITGAETEKTAADVNTSSADGLVSNRPQEAPSNEPLEVTTTKQSNGAIADSDSSDQVSEDSDTGLNGGDIGADTWRVHSEDEEVKEEEEEEEEILVVLELADFKNHPILDDYKSITIEGIDTPKPTLHIGEYALHGQLEETVGTHYFYDTKNRTDVNEYRYTGQTTKKIKFTIAPPEEY